MARDVELEKQIDAYIKGRLTEEQAQKLWEELLKNPDYIELLNTELGLQSMLANPEDTRRESSGRAEDHQAIAYLSRDSWKWLSAAAAVVILAIAISLFRMDSEQTLGELALSEITLSENLASAPTLRSEQHQVTPGDSLLNLGFKAAISGDLSGSLELYDIIIREYPEQPVTVQAHLNKGIIQFNRGNFREAIASFKEVAGKAGQNSFLREKAYWYLGNAYINTDSLSRAYDTIFETYSMEGIYQNPAGDLLQKLDEKLGNPSRDYN